MSPLEKISAMCRWYSAVTKVFRVGVLDKTIYYQLKLDEYENIDRAI